MFFTHCQTCHKFEFPDLVVTSSSEVEFDDGISHAIWMPKGFLIGFVNQNSEGLYYVSTDRVVSFLYYLRMGNKVVSTAWLRMSLHMLLSMIELSFIYTCGWSPS